MRKIHKWFLGIAIGLVVIAGASYLVIYVGSNMLLGALVSEDTGKLPNQKGEYDYTSESTKDKSEPEAGGADAEKDLKAENNQSDPSQPPEISEKTEYSADEYVDPPADVPMDKEDVADSSAVKDEPAADKPSADQESAESDPNRYTPEITEEKQEAIKEEITMGERVKLMTTLAGALSPSEISTFMKMAEGGLSIDEKKEAKKIMLEKLSEEEYNELIAIAAKYGLSEGKSYEQGVEEFSAN